MTVCVAAICDGGTIIGGSDRMITAGDVQFEPQQTKVVYLTKSIAVMFAGDSATQAEVIHRTRLEISHRVTMAPDEWVTVSSAADAYASHAAAVKSERAEIAFLRPLGLTRETFVANQQAMAPNLVTQLATEIIGFSIPYTAAIVTGVDDHGAHIYVVDGATVTCQDFVGFASIGAGYRHADSQLMFAGHTRARPLPATLLLVYSAKRRAEVAPGVGEGTDMFIIGPDLGVSYEIGDHVMARLDEIYRESRKQVSEAAHEAEEQVKKYVEEDLGANTAVQEQAAPAEIESPDATPHEETPVAEPAAEPQGGPID